MAHGDGYKFDVKKLSRLKDPGRLTYLHPDRLWELLAPHHLRALVELGAGLGFFAIPFARKIPAGRVYACDISQEMLEHLKQEILAAGVENVVPVKTGEVAVPLDDGIADLVLMANLHHELDHPDQTLAECRRLLAPGGRLAVVDWKPHQPTPSGPPLHVRIPPETVLRQMESAGFVEVTALDGLPHHYVATSRKPGAQPA